LAGPGQYAIAGPIPDSIRAPDLFPKTGFVVSGARAWPPIGADRSRREEM